MPSGSGYIRKSLGPLIAQASKNLSKIDVDKLEPIVKATENKKDTLTKLTDHLLKLKKLIEPLQRSADNIKAKMDIWYNLIENLSGDLKEEESNEFESFDEKTSMINTQLALEDCVGSLKLLISQTEFYVLTIQEGETGTTASAPVQSQPKAPDYVHFHRLQLPKFNGKSDWRAFAMVFNEAVVLNEVMPVSLKFRYLTECLQGEARELICSAYPEAPEHFQSAWETLKARYGTVEAQKRALMECLFSLKKPSSSSKEIQAFVNRVESLCKRMEIIGVSPNSTECLFALEKVLPDRLKVDIAKAKVKNANWDTKALRECLEYLLKVEMELSPSHDNNKPVIHKATHLASQEPTRQDCIFCNGTEHLSYQCPKYTTQSERKQRIKDQDRCLSCLQKIRHYCQKSCKICHKKGHHFLLCMKNRCYLDQPSSPSSSRPHVRVKEQLQKKQPERKFGRSTSFPKKTNILDESKSHNTMCSQDVSKIMMTQTLLPSLRIRISDPVAPHKAKVAVCLLDSGADSDYITTELANKIMSSPTQPATLVTSTFGGLTTEVPAATAEVCFESLNSDENFTGEVFIVRDISNYLRVPTSNQPGDQTMLRTSSCKVDALLGAKSYALICKLPKDDSGFSILNTQFGKAYMGTGEAQPGQRSSPQLAFTTLSKPKSEEELENLWSLETIAIDGKDYQSTADEEVFKKFMETLEFQNNRYTIRWPWKTPRPFVATNRNLAEARLKSLWKKYGEQDIWKCYEEILKEQENLGIIEEVKNEEIIQGDISHYIPHLPVHRPDHPSTAVRVVFDASAGKHSLNNAMEKGPPLVPLLIGIMLRIRLGRFLLVGDLAKAFLSIGLHPDDRDTTRFLWVKDLLKPPHAENIKIFRFTRLIFGNKSSPAVLAMTLHHLITTSAPASIKSDLTKNTYVDNTHVLTKDSDELYEKYQDQKKLFASASMKINKFSTNDKLTRSKIPEEDLESRRTVSLLGIQWDTEKDILFIKHPTYISNGKNTKRAVLSGLQRIYDPLGFYSPATLPMKLLIQRIWMVKLDWDDELPEDLRDEWLTFQNEWNQTKPVEEDRHIPLGDQPILHGFSDASNKAYACVAYLNGHLLMAKNRVNPVKTPLTTPRGELCGLLILMRLLKFLCDQLHVPHLRILAWTDSTISLSWIHADEPNNSLFIRNRVQEIKEIQSKYNIEIRHVPGEDNPADLASRGCSIETLRDQKSWWTGPSFIHEDEENWPITPIKLTDQEEDLIPERQIVQTFLAIKDKINPTILEIIEDSNSWDEAIEKFVLQLHLPRNQTGNELIKASQIIDGEPPSHLEKNLKLFYDAQGLIRCHFRPCPTFKPIYLPRDSKVTAWLITRTHEKLAHAGTTHTLAAIRQIGWIPHGRRVVDKIIHKCKQCQALKSKPFQLPTMNTLPQERTSEQLPFAYTALDYAGPFLVKKATPDSDVGKLYILLFSCMTTRLIHLEVTDDLSGQEFLNALIRFSSRRGQPKKLVSDNGTQLKATFNAFPEWFNHRNIKWKFIPEFGPFFGGHYERLIGIMKRSLKNMIGHRRLSEQEWRTTVVSLEAIVNTRPITYVSKEPSTILRPIDFVIPGLTLGMPEITLDDDYEDPDYLPQRRNRDKLIELYRAQCIRLKRFWDIFYREYVQLLKERSPWEHKNNKGVKRPPRLNEAVLIFEEGKDKILWRSGQIIELIYSSDRKIRAARVRVDGSDYIRPISKLYPLEDSEDEDSSDVQEDDKENPEVNRPTQRPRRSPRLQQLSLVTTIISTLLITSLVGNTKAEMVRHPILCPENGTRSYWYRPTPLRCPKFLDPVATKHGQKVSYLLIDKNSKIYEDRAYVCKITKRTVKYYTNFLGDKMREKDTTTFEKVSEAECLKMKKEKKCDYGLMSEESNTWHTRNPITLHFPNRFSSLFGSNGAQIYNCYLIETKIHATHRSKGIDTVMGTQEHCQYQDGKCELPEGHFISWIPTHEQECDYRIITTLNGLLFGSMFVDEEAQVALTVTHDVEHSTCHGIITITEQGFFVKRTQKVPDVKNTTGWENIAPKLQFVHLQAVKFDNLVIKKSLSVLCKVIEEQAKTIEMLTEADPTAVFRRLLNSTVTATRVTPDIYEIRQCQLLEEREYEITNIKSCVKEIPIQIKDSTSETILFMDPVSMVLRRKSQKINCDDGPRFVQLGRRQFLRYPNGRIKNMKARNLSINSDEVTLPTNELAMKATYLREVEIVLPLSVLGDVSKQNQYIEMNNAEEIVYQDTPSEMTLITDIVSSVWITLWRVYITIIAMIVTISGVVIISQTLRMAVNRRMEGGHDQKLDEEQKDEPLSSIVILSQLRDNQ